MRTILLCSILTFSLGQITTDWTIAADYAVKFSTNKAEGTFDKLQGSIQFDPSTPADTKIDVWVETATISTGNKSKDKHARGSKWLDADQYPKIIFKSSSCQKAKSGYAVNGKLSIHGVTKEVRLPFTFKNQVFAGSLTINRQDYGIEGPFLFGGLVGDDITITLRVPVTPQ